MVNGNDSSRNNCVVDGERFSTHDYQFISDPLLNPVNLISFPNQKHRMSFAVKYVQYEIIQNRYRITQQRVKILTP